MTALSAPIKRQRIGDPTTGVPRYAQSGPIILSVAAATTIYPGALVAANAAGAIVNASADITQKVLGVYDGGDTINTSLAAATIAPAAGVFAFVNSDTITVAHIGQPAFVVDNATIAKSSSSNTRPCAGTIVGVSTDWVWVQVGVESAALASPAPDEHHVIGRVVAADAAASTATAEYVIGRFPQGAIIQNIKISPTGAVTAHDTTYATITVQKRDGAGGAASTVVAQTTKSTGGSGSWVAFTTLDMGTLTGATVTAGTIITLTITKASSGVQLPTFNLTVNYLPVWV
jgi:hypothetical protein